MRSQPGEERLLRIVDEMVESGMTAVLFTGGEPMLRQPLLLRLLRAAKKGGMYTAVATNGFWAKTLPAARGTLRSLQRAGLDRFTLSYDRYHAEFQGPEPGRHLVQAAEELGVPMNVNITRVADDSEIADLIEPFEKSTHARLRIYDVQPIGRARSFETSSLRAELDGMCNAAGTPAVTDDLRVTACNGPSYFMRADSPLVLGSLDETPLAELLRRHRDDLILETIRLFGPQRLREELTRIPGFEDFPFKAHYGGMCELCLDINSRPEVARALRDHLADPRLAAERAARRRVIEGARARGEMGFDHANGVGVARLWLTGAAASTPEERERLWGQDAERVFGRFDLDWKRAATYLIECGVGRAVLPVLDDPRLKRWAPSIFAERMRPAAIAEATRELLQVEAIRRINAELEKIGATGVLLKGAAILAVDRDARADASVRGLPRRSAGDIDVAVDSRHAPELRRRLLASGFTGEAEAGRTGPHHLGPVFFRGVPVEIHTRIMPRAWRLPEKEMLERTKALCEYSSLSTLDYEGMLMHSLVHCTAHLYSHGLKAAWDATWLLERSPSMDWERIVRWAAISAMPAAFFIPAAVFQRDLGLAFPQAVLDKRPRGTRIDSLERVASLRLFSAMEGAFDLNPITKNGFFLLLHGRWRDRIAYARTLIGEHERESRRVARMSAKSSAGKAGRDAGMVEQLRQSMAQWSRYRRTALASVLRERQLREERLFSAL
ncbi:MAG: nucleotidyltransferase family protein [Gemmatimonadota bacterium]|nr:nucleotidyltransferase family protein [Gemmatimonadota bacterium]